MKAKIQKNLRKQFIPFFVTVIMGNPTKVSLKDAEKYPEKYINTPIGPLYENFNELRSYLKGRTKKDDTVVLDMRQGDRGFVFDKNHKSKKDIHLEKMIAKSKKDRAKIASRVDAQLKEREDNQKAIDEAVKAGVEKAKKAEKAKVKKEEKAKVKKEEKAKVKKEEADTTSDAG